MIKGFNLNVEGCEELWVKISLGKAEALVVVMYRHPVYNITEFQNSSESSLESINKKR